MCRPTIEGDDDINLDEDESESSTHVYTIIAVISAIIVLSSAMYMMVLATRKPITEKCMQEWQHEVDGKFDDDFGGSVEKEQDEAIEEDVDLEAEKPTKTVE